MRLENKVAIVTGATSGMGRATAYLFAKEGAKVVITGRNEERAKEVVDNIKAAGGEAIYVLGDASDLAFCDEIVNKTIEAFGTVDILNPRSCYPSSKRAAETLAICYAREYGADIVIARPCHTFGPYFQDSDQRAYAQFIRNAEAGKDLILKSDGSHYRSWCYVVDCATALLTILLKGHSGQAYNIADKNCETSMRILAETIARLGNVSLQVGQPDASSGQRVVFDTTLLEELGWKTEGTLADKLTHTLSTRKMKADEKEH